MAKQYWLIKSEPSKYPWSQLLQDGSTTWDGIRNYAARLNLLAMKKGDECLYYHSNEGKEIVGIATVVKEAFQDPTSDDDRWVAVEVQSKKTLKSPVSLNIIKNHAILRNMELVRLSRLSVSKVTAEEFKLIVDLSN